MRKLLAIYILVISFCFNNYAQGKTDSLRVHFSQRNNSSEQVDSLIDLCQQYNSLSVDSSIYYGHLALKAAHNIKYNEGIRSALYEIGRTNIQALNYDEALRYLQESMQYTDTIKQSKQAANTVNNMGIVYYLTGDYSKSLSFYLRALYLHTEVSEVGVKLNYNIGIIKAEQKAYDSSIYFFKRAYQLSNKVVINDKTIKPYIQANLAEIYSLMGNESLALIAARQSIKDFNSMENLTDPGLFISLGSTYRSINELDKAEKTILKAIVMAQKAKTLRRERNAYQFLIEIYRDQGKYELALEAYEKYTRLNDSTLNLEKNKQILELEAKYESEKKEQAIEILQKEAALSDAQLKRSRLRNYFFILLTLLGISIFILLYREYKNKVKTNAKLNEANSSLTTSENRYRELNTMKDNLIRIIGHDLKGPIGSVVGFSELLSRVDFQSKPDKALQYASVIFNTSSGVSLLLDNILYWARIQQGSYKINPVNFSPQKVINEAIDPLYGMAENKEVTILSEVDNSLKAFGDPITCGIVLGNLINNAIKFSFRGCKIHVSAIEEERGVLFKVKDEGTGMNEEQINKLFIANSFNSIKGTNEEKGTGLGLKICKQFVELNGGEIMVESELGMGSCFSFAFPKV